jgi:hypothetical protein
MLFEKFPILTRYNDVNRLWPTYDIIVTSIRFRSSIFFLLRDFFFILTIQKKSNKWIKQILSNVFFINYSYRRINRKNSFFIICFLFQALNEFVRKIKIEINIFSTYRKKLFFCILQGNLEIKLVFLRVRT